MENAFKATSCSVLIHGIPHGMKHSVPKHLQPQISQDEAVVLGSECTERGSGSQGKAMEVAVGGAVGTELRPLGCRGRATRHPRVPRQRTAAALHISTPRGLKIRRLGRGEKTHRNSKQ